MDWRAVAVALVVLLAGCGSVFGGDETEQGGPAETLTPAPVPEVTATPVSLPTGVTDSGVRDPDALLAAHDAALRNRSYTLEIRLDVDDERYRRFIRVETQTRYYQHDAIDGPRGNVTRFADGPALYTRSEFAGVTRYDRLNNTRPPISRTVRLSRIFLRAPDADVFKVSTADGPAFVIRGTYPTHPLMENVRNLTLRAVVEPDGLVRSMNATYVRLEGTSRSNVTPSFVYSDVGATAVERPDWVDREYNETDARPTASRVGTGPDRELGEQSEPSERPEPANRGA